jgi:hypothetical protein
MRHPIFAILLCVLAIPAIAQTAPPTPRPASKHTTTSASARPAPEIIKTAGAATHDRSDGAQATVRQHDAARADDHSRDSGGMAMLLAALAVMAGIALRRFSRHQ